MNLVTRTSGNPTNLLSIRVTQTVYGSVFRSHHKSSSDTYTPIQLRIDPLTTWSVITFDGRVERASIRILWWWLDVIVIHQDCAITFDGREQVL